MSATGQPPDPPTAQPLNTNSKSYAEATAPSKVAASTPSWFKFNHIPLPPRPATVIDNDPTCFFSPVEIDQSAKQFEQALIMKFSTGRPSIHEIKLHIKLH